MTFGARPARRWRPSAVAREMDGGAREAAVDWFLHPVLAGRARAPAGEIAALAERGHTSIKMFLSNPDFAADAWPGSRRSAAAKAGRLADAGALRGRRDAQARGPEADREGRGAVANFPDARPVSAEVEAVDQAIGSPADRRADLHRAPVVGRRPGPLPPGPGGGPAGLRGDQAAVPAPDQGALRRAGRGQVRRRPAAAGPIGPRRAVAGLAAGDIDTRLQRPRAVDAGRQARPRAHRGHRPAGRRRPGDADADAVLRGRRRPGGSRSTGSWS
jgi:hypothetical protein